MDYELMDLMSNGIIICDFETLEISYVNKMAKKYLNISQDFDKLPLDYLFKSEISLLSFTQEMLDKIGKVDNFSGIMYLNTKNCDSIKITYHGKVVSVDEKKICYVFDNVEENNDKQNISYRDLTEELPSSIMIISAQSEFLIKYVSKEYYNIVGHDERDDNQAIQDDLRRLVYEEDREWFMTEMYNYMHCNEDIDIEFRIKTKGGIKWARMYGRFKVDENNERKIYAVLKDISYLRQPNEKEHMERVLLHKVTELSNEILFRIDLQTGIVYFLGGRVEDLKMNTVVEGFPNSEWILQKIYEEDMAVFEEMVENFNKGISKPTDIRVVASNGDIKWYQIVYNFVRNTAKKPLLVIGKIVDIQEKKALEERARFDVLTKCYNKATTASEIQNIIHDGGAEGRHVFFIIDVDNFKAINDNLGHHFGDLVLQEVADTIKQAFRKQDVVGRIGGDEFVVFMADCDNDDIILEKANKLSEVMRKTYSGENESYSISGSIGISLFPSHGFNYEELYKAADKALYESKKQGKDCYTLFYTEITDDNRTTTEMNNGGRNRNQLVDIGVISTVFNLLYETRDINISLKSVVQYLGIHFDVDRCYIFECLGDETKFSNNYEWTRRLSSSAEKEVQYITKDEFEDIFTEATDEGVVIVNNIDSGRHAKVKGVFRQNKVKAILLIESLKEAEERVFFGVEDCTDERRWSDREIRTLFQVSRIIFAFVINYNKENMLEDKLRKLLEDKNN